MFGWPVSRDYSGYGLSRGSQVNPIRLVQSWSHPAALWFNSVAGCWDVETRNAWITWFDMYGKTTVISKQHPPLLTVSKLGHLCLRVWNHGPPWFPFFQDNLIRATTISWATFFEGMSYCVFVSFLPGGLSLNPGILLDSFVSSPPWTESAVLLGAKDKWSLLSPKPSYLDQ